MILWLNLISYRVEKFLALLKNDEYLIKINKHLFINPISVEMSKTTKMKEWKKMIEVKICLFYWNVFMWN